jgi:hypothetical protein
LTRPTRMMNARTSMPIFLAIPFVAFPHPTQATHRGCPPAAR